MSAPAYRRDIDGLRALCIALVVAFHFGSSLVSGGFIGVDLFFVISGFLITTLFDREPVLTWAVIGGFYNRRIKRLLPAFLLVAAVTTIAAAALLLPDDFDEFLKSLRESFLFRANVHFQKATTGYFASNAAEMPWLHTWSLAVEWQFYFVFPLVVWLLRRAPSSRILLLTVLIALGLGWSVVLTDGQPAVAYLSARARFFEFLLGALAASFRAPRVAPAAARTISALCVAALLLLSTIIEPSTPFPGLVAFGVTAIGFVLIVVGRFASVLSSEPLAFIGRRSYAAYLWHWPIVALLSYVQHRPSIVEIVSWLAVIAVLSDVTHRFVERPGVAARWSLPVTVALCCVAPLIVAGSAYVVVRDHDGFPARLGDEAIRVSDTLRGYDTARADRCHGYRSADLEPCAFGDLAATRSALMIGDSHARHFEPFVDVMAAAAHVKVYGLTSSECLSLEGVRLPATFASRDECGAAIDRDFRLIRARRFDYVLIAQRWDGYPIALLQRLDETLRLVVATGAVPVLFEQGAEDGTNTRDCFFRHIKLRRAAHEDCAIARDNPFIASQRRQAEALIESMRERYPTLRIVDVQSVQCRQDRCETVIDDVPIYSDTHHFDAYGSTMLARDYLTRIGNPLAP